MGLPQPAEMSFGEIPRHTQETQGLPARLRGALGHLTSQLLGPPVVHCLVIRQSEFLLGITCRLRPKNVAIWDYPGNGEPVEICPGEVHIGVLEDITEEHEQYDVDPAHLGL
jgi:hypothetical protein